jgi:hypothetical protein
MSTNTIEPQLIWNGTLPISTHTGMAPESANLSLYDYTEKSVALTTGESFGKSYSHVFKNIGSFNPRLKVGPGWIFSKAKYPELQALISNITSGQVQPQPQTGYTSRSPSRQINYPGPTMNPTSHGNQWSTGHTGTYQNPTQRASPRLNLRQDASKYSGSQNSANYDITGQNIPPPPGVRNTGNFDPPVNHIISQLLNRLSSTNGMFEAPSPETQYQRITLWGAVAEVERQLGDFRSRGMIEVARFSTSDRLALVLDLPHPRGSSHHTGVPIPVNQSPLPVSPPRNHEQQVPLRPASPPRINSPVLPPRSQSPQESHFPGSRPSSPRPVSPPRINSPVRSPMSPSRLHSINPTARSSSNYIDPNFSDVEISRLSIADR